MDRWPVCSLTQTSLRQFGEHDKYLPNHWCSHLNAWAKIRKHYEATPPPSFEAVQAMELWDSQEFTHEGRPLPRTQWELVCGDTCTVGDLWNRAESRYNTASELGIYV